MDSTCVKCGKADDQYIVIVDQTTHTNYYLCRQCYGKWTSKWAKEFVHRDWEREFAKFITTLGWE